MGIREFGATLGELRQRAGLTKADVARAVGIVPSYITRLERGDHAYKSVGQDVLRNLAGVLGTTDEHLEALLYDRPVPRPPTPTPEMAREIPVVADLSAGPIGGGVVEHYEYVALSETRGRLLRAGPVTGGCLVPEISPGDTVIFDAAKKQPRDGQLIVATIPDPGNEKGRGVVKRFYRVGNRVKLDCNVGEPILLPADQVRIEGVVVEVRRKYAP